MRNEVLSKKRHKQKLSQRELAQKVGVSGAMVCQWETGKLPISWEKAVKLSHIIKVKAEKLYLTNRRPSTARS